MWPLIQNDKDHILVGFDGICSKHDSVLFHTDPQTGARTVVVPVCLCVLLLPAYLLSLSLGLSVSLQHECSWTHRVVIEPFYLPPTHSPNTLDKRTKPPPISDVISFVAHCHFSPNYQKKMLVAKWKGHTLWYCESTQNEYFSFSFKLHEDEMYKNSISSPDSVNEVLCWLLLCFQCNITVFHWCIFLSFLILPLDNYLFIRPCLLLP